MKTIDYRNATWDQVQQLLDGLRLTAYSAWEKFGPGTTREVAARAGMDLLTFRPRSTELFQLGLIRIHASAHEGRKHEGIYIAVPLEEVKSLNEAALDEAHGRAAEQFLLDLSGPVPAAKIPNAQGAIRNL